MNQAVSVSISERMDARRRGDFELIGRISKMQTPHGPMIWARGAGPFVGFIIDRSQQAVPVRTAKLVMVSVFSLPPIRETSEEPCSMCRVACDLCNASGKKLCERCGGNKTIAGGLVPCFGPGCMVESGKFKATCKTCGGRGEIQERKKCPCCDGTAEQVCPQCRGTKQCSTGGTIKAPCAACRGSRFQVTEIAQPWEKFVNAWIRQPDWPVLGPITRFVVDAMPGSDVPTLVFDVNPDMNGDYLVLVLDRTTGIDGLGYLIGGVFDQHSQASGRGRGASELGRGAGR